MQIYVFDTIHVEGLYNYYIFALIILIGIFKGCYDLFKYYKIKVVEAIVIDSKPLSENITDDNVNFLITVKLNLPDLDNPIINIKGLFLRKLKSNEKIKVIVNEKIINESKIFTGTEFISSLIQIIVLTAFFIFLIYFKIHSPS